MARQFDFVCFDAWRWNSFITLGDNIYPQLSRRLGGNAPDWDTRGPRLESRVWHIVLLLNIVFLFFAVYFCSSTTIICHEMMPILQYYFIQYTKHSSKFYDILKGYQDTDKTYLKHALVFKNTPFIGEIVVDKNVIAWFSLRIIYLMMYMLAPPPWSLCVYRYPGCCLLAAKPEASSTWPEVTWPITWGLNAGAVDMVN